MDEHQCHYDLLGKQQMQKDQAEALRKYIENAGKIDRILEELHEHNRQFSELNQEMKQEASDRERGDWLNRWFTVGVSVLTFLLGLIASHWGVIMGLARSLLHLK